MALAFILAVPVRAACVHDFIPMRQEPTCDKDGFTWQECRLCGYSTEYKSIKSPGHTFGEWYVLEEPGCFRDGLNARNCLICNFQETVPIASTGHRYDGGVIIREPTMTAMGRILHTCLICGDTYQTTIPMLTNPFEDIDKQAYYFTPVLWAASNGITSGLDETHFGPDVLCTRAQVVTFLWRSAGKPVPQTGVNPFVDVPAGCYYEQAVLWAYESGITSGTDTSHFSPDGICNRAQVVTFLHRAKGCPEPAISTVFPDIPAGSFYHKAVLWAAQREITVGMDGGLFHPEQSCSRAQTVTFLYRDVKNP